MNFRTYYYRYICFLQFWRAPCNQMEFTESFPICQNSNSSIRSTPLVPVIFPIGHQRILSGGSPLDQALRKCCRLGCQNHWNRVAVHFEGILLETATWPDSWEGSSFSCNQSFRLNKKQQKAIRHRNPLNRFIKCFHDCHTTVAWPCSWNGLPDGRFLAAWPQDTSIIFVLCPQSTGASVNEPLCVFKNFAVGIASFKWTPDSTGLLVNLQYGMGIKYWRLDYQISCSLVSLSENSWTGWWNVFSQDGKHLAILHRRDAVDHIAIYKRNNQSEDWNVYA